MANSSNSSNSSNSNLSKVKADQFKEWLQNHITDKEAILKVSSSGQIEGLGQLGTALKAIMEEIVKIINENSPANAGAIEIYNKAKKIAGAKLGAASDAMGKQFEKSVLLAIQSKCSPEIPEAFKAHIDSAVSQKFGGANGPLSDYDIAMIDKAANQVIDSMLKSGAQITLLGYIAGSNPIGDLYVECVTGQGKNKKTEKIILELKWTKSPDAAVKWSTIADADYFYMSLMEAAYRERNDDLWDQDGNPINEEQWVNNIRKFGASQVFLYRAADAKNDAEVLKFLLHKGKLFGDKNSIRHGFQVEGNGQIFNGNFTQKRIVKGSYANGGTAYLTADIDALTDFSDVQLHSTDKTAFFKTKGDDGQKPKNLFRISPDPSSIAQHSIFKNRKKGGNVTQKRLQDATAGKKITFISYLYKTMLNDADVAATGLGL